MAEHDPTVPSQVVDQSGLAVVQAGEYIVSAKDAAALLRPAPAATVNYYFPVEIEILGASTAKAIAEQIHEALQRDIGSMG